MFIGSRKIRIVLAVIALLGGLSLRAQTPEFEWRNSAGGESDDAGNDVVVDASGNVYTTGYFEGIADFDPGPGSNQLVSHGRSDAFVTKVDKDGMLLWAHGIGGPARDEGMSLVVDGDGNVYASGTFSGSVDFDPGPGMTAITSGGGTDVFVVKFNSQGIFQWVRTFGGNLNDYSYSLRRDTCGHIYVAGTFYSPSVDFDPGSGVFMLTSAGDFDIFILKLDLSGNFVWARKMGGPGEDAVYSIAVERGGDICMTGEFEGTSDFDPGPGTYNLTSAGTQMDIFVVKISASGDFSWARSFGDNAWDAGQSVAIDKEKNVYVTGFFQGTVDFDAGQNVDYQSSAGLSDVFLLKLDSQGKLLWSRSFGGTLNEYGYALATDLFNDVYLTGFYQGQVDFNPHPTSIYKLTSNGSTDVYIAKFSASGQFSWARSMGGSALDFGLGIAVDHNKSVVITGFYEQKFYFDTPHTLLSEGGSDQFTLKTENALTLGVSESAGIGVSRVYPNPFVNTAKIHLEEPLSDASLIIYNVEGKQAGSRHHVAGQEILLEGSRLAPGVYHFEIKQEFVTVSRGKFIVGE